MTANKRIMAFKHAFNGIKTIISDEFHAKVHLATSLIVIFAAWYLNLNTFEWTVILMCIGGVISLEAINTSIENLTDLVTQEKHPLAKKAKDTAAAAVLIFSIITAIIGVIIFLPKINVLWM